MKALLASGEVSKADRGMALRDAAYNGYDDCAALLREEVAA